MPYVDQEYDTDVDGNNNKVENLNEPLTALSCSSIKRVHSDRTDDYGNRKYNEVTEKLVASFSDALPCLEDRAACSDILMQELKEKFHSSISKFLVKIQNSSFLWNIRVLCKSC